MVLNVATELAKGPHAATIASLFPRNEEMESWSEGQLRNYARQVNQLPNRNFDLETLAQYAGEYRITRGNRSSSA